MAKRETKAFPTGAVLSMLTGKLVSENHMEGLYEVANFMTGENVFTHQMPRIFREASPVILAFHPHLRDAVEEAEQVNQDNWREWLDTWKARYGDEITVPVMTRKEHRRIDALTEFVSQLDPNEYRLVDF